MRIKDQKMSEQPQKDVIIVRVEEDGSYQVVDQGRATKVDELTEKIKAAQKEIYKAFRVTLLHAKKIGELLIEAKPLLPHGSWEAWVERTCDLNRRTAQIYMLIAKRWDLLEKEISKTKHAALLTINKALGVIRAEDEKLAKHEAQVIVPCPTCGQGFDRQVWHCTSCGNHLGVGQPCPDCGKVAPGAGASPSGESVVKVVQAEDGSESTVTLQPPPASAPASPGESSVKPVQDESSSRSLSPPQPTPASPSTPPEVGVRSGDRRRFKHPSGPPEDAAGNPAKVTDARGVRLTPALQDAFNDLHLPTALECLREGARHLFKAAKSNKWVDFDWLITRPLRDIFSFIKYRMPFVVHQGCRGEGCLDCYDTGYLTEEAVELFRAAGLSESEEGKHLTLDEIRSIYPDDPNEYNSAGEADVGDVQPDDGIPD
jgi:hypothetical protein